MIRNNNNTDKNKNKRILRRRDRQRQRLEDSSGIALGVDVIVVGNGPLGAALGVHLASVSSSSRKSVLILDSGSESLSSGSDDLGKIVRPLDAEGRDEWTQLNIDSIQSFKKVQEESEIYDASKRKELERPAPRRSCQNRRACYGRKDRTRDFERQRRDLHEVCVPESKDDSGGVRRGFRSSGRIRFPLIRCARRLIGWR